MGQHGRVKARRRGQEGRGSVGTSAALGSALLFAACVQNHDILAEQPGTSGAGGSAGRPSTSAGGAGGVGAVGDGGPPSIQPDGPRTLTLVNGVIDSPWIALCFAPVKGGVESPVKGAPVPESGLMYGHTAAFDSLPDIDLDTDGVRPYLVAGGGPSAAAGLDCAAIVAHARATPLPPVPAPDASPIPADASDSGIGDASLSPDGSRLERDAATQLDASPTAAVDARSVDATVPIPLVRFAALPVIPSGQLVVARGYLLVLGGCIGGPGVTDPSEQSICGDSYSPETPTLGPELVAVSPGAPTDRVALAFLDGTPALSPCDIHLSPSKTGDSISLAQNVVTGALRPRSPLTQYGAQDIASMSSEASIQIYPRGSDQALYDESWRQTLDAGNVSGLANAQAYTLILVGSPGFPARRWWNDPLVTIVKN